MSHNPIKEQKRELRHYYRKVLRELSPETHKNAAKRAVGELSVVLNDVVTEVVSDQPPTEPSPLVLTYVPMAQELDITEINEELWRRGQLVLPRVPPRGCGHILELYHMGRPETCSEAPGSKLDLMDLLVQSAYGILEPNPRHSKVSRVDPQDPRLVAVLVPGLAFDPSTGTRLGRGAGYYDRLLLLMTERKSHNPALTPTSALPTPTPTPCFLGIGFREQSASGQPSEPHDVRMHKVFLF